MNSKRGEVWLTALYPTVGSEIQKTRPVVVVSNDINNANNSVVSVVPITSNVARILSFEVFIPAGVASLTKDSKAKADQIRTLDKSRLIKRYGMLPIIYVQHSSEITFGFALIIKKRLCMHFPKVVCFLGSAYITK